MTDSYEVVVIGGGAAGLSGAIALVRSRRRVLVIDAGEPRNARADGLHGFLTRDGMKPTDLTAIGRDEVRSYGGEIIQARVVAAEPTAEGFAVTCDDGQVVTAKRLLIATGLTDELPDIPGLRERFGHDVIHCPYCHGYEVRDQAIGIIATSAHVHHHAVLFRQLSDDVAVLLHTAPAMASEEEEQLNARGIKLIAGEVVAVETDGGRLTGVRLAGGEFVARDALVVGPRFTVNTAGIEGLGLEIAEHSMGMGSHIAADTTGRTSVPGVWVAGNAANEMAQVVSAADAGLRAGAVINADLAMEEAQLAVAAAAQASYS